MRLDQYLVKSNICSRSEAKKIIKKGRVCINGVVVKDSALHVEPSSDEVKLDGAAIGFEEFRYFMLNKPAGCVSATKDGLSQTVIELLSGEDTRDLFPVGRLDKDTEGLLLITNDGKLAHELLSPRHHVDKIYEAMVDGELSDEEMQQFMEGLDIGDEKKTMPAKIEKVGEAAEAEGGSDDGRDGGSENSGSENAGSEHVGSDEKVYIRNNYVYRVTIHEGRFHQVKRMFEAVGKHVIFLKRVSMGPLMLDEGLEKGSYRRLTQEELNCLKNMTL